jgi:hypothetical protein
MEVGAMDLAAREQVSAPRISPGMTTNEVRVRVDFALGD